MRQDERRAERLWSARGAAGLSLLGAVIVLAALSGVACGGSGDAAASSERVAAPVAPLDIAFRSNGFDLLPMEDASLLPVAPGAVNVQWHMFRGWYVAVFDGLDLASTGPLCLTTSILNAESGELEHASRWASVEGACDDPLVRAVLASGATTGVRDCGGVTAYVSRIPADIAGTLVATITAFPGDGTGVSVSARVDAVPGQFPELDGAKLDCAPLPLVRPMRTPTPTIARDATPAPPSAGRVAAADRTPPPTPHRPEACVVAEPGLQDVTTSPAGPYLVHHPAVDARDGATVVFLGGGGGRRSSAERLWEDIFAGREATDEIRVVLPYAVSGDFIDEARRTFEVVNEVLWCYGGDPARVHLAGASNGGLAAFALMTTRPELFATLLGAPGAFPVQDPSTVAPSVWAQALGGRAVFNGVGANDAAWRPEVIATHNALAAAGVESVFVEFPGQGHVLTSAVDANLFLAFWASH